MKVCNWCEKSIKGKQHIQVQISDLIKFNSETKEVEGRWKTYTLHETDCLDNFVKIIKQFSEPPISNGYKPDFIYIQVRKRNILAKSHFNGTLKEYCLTAEKWKKISDIIKEFESNELERIISNTRIEPEDLDVKRLKQGCSKGECD